MWITVIQPAVSHGLLYDVMCTAFSRKLYATMPKVIMGNGGFYSWLSEPQGVSMLSTHNTNRHCRLSFYTFVGQPLSK